MQTYSVQHKHRLRTSFPRRWVGGGCPAAGRCTVTRPGGWRRTKGSSGSARGAAAMPQPQPQRQEDKAGTVPWRGSSNSRQHSSGSSGRGVMTGFLRRIEPSQQPEGATVWGGQAQPAAAFTVRPFNSGHTQPAARRSCAKEGGDCGTRANVLYVRTRAPAHPEVTCPPLPAGLFTIGGLQLFVPAHTQTDKYLFSLSIKKHHRKAQLVCVTTRHDTARQQNTFTIESR